MVWKMKERSKEATKLEWRFFSQTKIHERPEGIPNLSVTSLFVMRAHQSLTHIFYPIPHPSSAILTV